MEKKKQPLLISSSQGTYPNFSSHGLVSKELPPCQSTRSYQDYHDQMEPKNRDYLLHCWWIDDRNHQVAPYMNQISHRVMCSGN